MFLNHRSSKCLIVGSGSGRDIASSILVRELLRQKCQRVDIAGFLPPWAFHRFNGEIEQPINLPFKWSKRFIPGKENKPLRSFFEPILFELNNKYSLSIENIYVFSLHYGTYLLGEKIKELIRQNEYDTIIIVDVGGDILIKEDINKALTPIVDLSCLGIFAGMAEGVNLYLSIIAPGATGEISYIEWRDIFQELEFYCLDRIRFNALDDEYIKYNLINKEINSRTASRSLSAWVIEENIHKRGNILYEFTKYYKIGRKKYEIKFKNMISAEEISSVYFFNFRGIADRRRNSIMQFETVLEGFIKAKEMGFCGTEVDLSLVPNKKINANNIKFIFLLTPCCHVKGALRGQIILDALNVMEREGLNDAILLKEDKINGYIPSHFKLYEIGKFYYLSRSRTRNLAISKMIKELSKKRRTNEKV